MAITKILNLGMPRAGESSSHLYNSLCYIVNSEKTEEKTLVGSVNCLPVADMAYKQMVETKKFFGKQTGRQGYQIIISFEKGETTPDVALRIAEEFTEEYLKNQYECVYAVHDDKEHCHIHIVFNSVSLETGRKFSYKKGDWKYVIQPITNRLCEKYGLNIMPAEYAVEKTNLPRDIYNQQQEYREYIRKDCEYLLGIAEDVDHFIWLLRQLGYTVKEGKHISVTIPGMKRYARIDTIDKRFSREAIADRAGRRPRIVSLGCLTKPVLYEKRVGSVVIIGFRRQLRGMRAADVHRFRYHSAYLYREIRKFYRLQEEYLFLCDNKVNTVEELLDLKKTIDKNIETIDQAQKKIYRENAAFKRKCKTLEDFNRYQFIHLKNEEKLEVLKEKKRECRKQADLFQRCYGRVFLEVLDRIAEEWENREIEATQEELLAEIPEYPPHKERREAEERAAKEKAEREAAEKAACEKAEREAAEKAAKMKAEQDAADRVADEIISMYQVDVNDTGNSRLNSDGIVPLGAESEVHYDGGRTVGGITEDVFGETYQYYRDTGSENKLSDDRQFEAFLAEQRAKRASSGRRGRDSELERANREAEQQRQGVGRGGEDPQRGRGSKVR